jgi:hypothetical protein
LSQQKLHCVFYMHKKEKKKKKERKKERKKEERGK